MASSFHYQFHPQPPSVPPHLTGGKRGPSGPLTVSSSSEDEDSDASETSVFPLSSQQAAISVRTTDFPRSPQNVQVIPLSPTPVKKIGGGKWAPARLSPRKDATAAMVTTGSAEQTVAQSDLEPSPFLISSPKSWDTSSPSFAHELDHDYENVASPCSSTASGPTYVRPPGFVHHAQEVESVKSKTVRKKSRPAAVLSFREGLKKREQTPPKVKPRRDPLPMKLRALPQSFWQQPNVTQQVSPACMFPVLPPLCNKDTEEDIAEVRPITPPQDSAEYEKGDKAKQPPQTSERKITVANTDLLFKLFENIGSAEKKAAALQLKRGRPKRVVSKSTMKGLLSGNDPYLMDAIAEKLFPQLSIETSRHSGHTTLQLITLGTGDKSVTLPSLSVEQNYPQMLSELVMHI